MMFPGSPFQIARLMQPRSRLARYAGSRRRVNFGSPTDGPATAPGSCYAPRPPILEHTRTSWRSRTISRHASKGSWRENRVSRRSNSAEALALRQLTPPRRLNLSRMRGRELPALASRAGNETLSRAPAAAAKFRASCVESIRGPRRRGPSADTASTCCQSFKKILL